MKKTEYLSQCCNTPVKVDRLPDFEGDKYPCITYYVCTKCNKPCDIKGQKKKWYTSKEIWDKEWDVLLKGIKDIEEGKVTKVDSVDKMFEEIDATRKKHPIYHFFSGIFWGVCRYLDGLPLRVKTFIQRGKRGWANSDTWGFDYYLSKVISEGLGHLRRYTHGMPNNLTEGQWIDILNKITYTFESAKRISKDELYLIKDKKQREKWQKTLDEINKKYKSRDRCMTNKEIREYEEGWRLFKQYFFDLWD